MPRIVLDWELLLPKFKTGPLAGQDNPLFDFFLPILFEQLLRRAGIESEFVWQNPNLVEISDLNNIFTQANAAGKSVELHGYATFAMYDDPDASLPAAMAALVAGEETPPATWRDYSAPGEVTGPLTNGKYASELNRGGIAILGSVAKDLATAGIAIRSGEQIRDLIPSS